MTVSVSQTDGKATADAIDDSGTPSANYTPGLFARLWPGTPRGALQFHSRICAFRFPATGRNPHEREGATNRAGCVLVSANLMSTYTSNDRCVERLTGSRGN